MPDGHGIRLLQKSAHVESWPPVLADGLPAEPWLAVLARPRQDKLLVSALRRRSLPGLMLYERRVRTYSRGRRGESLVPLIGAWVFVNSSEWHRIWDTEHAARILPVRRPDVFVRELADLIALLRGCRGIPEIRPELQPGVRVRLTAGPLRGLCGIILQRRSRSRLVVNLHALGTSASIELPAESAESAERAGPAEPPAEAEAPMA